MKMSIKTFFKVIDRARLHTVISLERTMKTLSYEINEESPKKHFYYFLWIISYLTRGYVLYGTGVAATVLAMTIISNNYASPEVVMLPAKSMMSKMPDVILNVANVTIHNTYWGAVAFGLICFAAYAFVNHGFVGNDMYLNYKNEKKCRTMKHSRVIRMSSYVQTHNDNNVRRA